MLTGSEDGFIKIFDTQMRLLLWFEKIKIGPVLSISFRYSVPARLSKLVSPDNLIDVNKTSIY